MTRRMLIGTVAVLTGGLLAGAGALAWGQGARAAHGAFMKRMVAAAVDEALDAAQVTPEQRTAIHGTRDRVFAAFEEHRRTRGARLDEALALFESDQVDPTRVEAVRRQAAAEHQRLGDVFVQAVTEVHDVLTPAQRTLLAAWVRQHRPSHMN